MVVKNHLEIEGLRFPPEVVDYLRIDRGERPRHYRENDDFESMIRARVETTAAEIRDILPYVAAERPVVWDIGCGLALADALMMQQKPFAKLYLTEGTGDMSKKRMGFHEQTEPWFNVSIARSFLVENFAGLTLEIEDWPEPNSIDLVISLFSWGFHYPVDIYLDAVKECLAPEGVVVLDLRRGRGADNELEIAGFRWAGFYDGDRKRERTVWRAPK